MLEEWLHGVHHDSTDLYLSNPSPTLDEIVTIWLRVPMLSPVQKVYLRIEPDGEQHHILMDYDRGALNSNWYKARFQMRNRVMRYRFKIETDRNLWHYNAMGVSLAEPTDHYDFKLLADFSVLEWVSSAVFYQIFPDRFFKGDPDALPRIGETHPHPSGSIFKTQLLPWDAPPLNWSQGGNVDFYGGDLAGIAQKLDYLKELGVNALYLNPIFDSGSNHKYNPRDYFNVDPGFGGNQALVKLRKALDETGFYLILDVTPNHCGSDHPWFTAAQANIEADTSEFFTFNRHPEDYECWLGRRSLPKFNYASQKLRDIMYKQRHSILQFWLSPPFRIDGWRLDVWNMTARQGAFDDSRQVGREIRQVLKSEHPEAYIFGESFFDASASLQGDELDGAMNYRGFSFPLWGWLTGHSLSDPGRGLLPAEAAVEQMLFYMASIPWAIALNQFNQLGSHDTPRILSVLGGRKDLAKVAAAVLLTFPGVPCIYYGDEIGMDGAADGSHRAPMRWSASDWDKDMRAFYQKFITLRKRSTALKSGGFQVAYAEGALLAYLRQCKEEKLLIIAYRGGVDNHQVSLPIWRADIPNETILEDDLNGEQFTVTDGTLRLSFDHLARVMVLREK